MSDRVSAPQSEAPVPGESRIAAQERQFRNRRARAEWELYAAERCASCGFARANVIHEQDPATSIEGPDYYADFLDGLHPFVPTTPP